MVEQPKLPTRVPSVLEDPSAQAIARMYATAFLNAAELFGVPDALDELASFVEDVLDRFPEFALILGASGISRDEKLGIIDRVVAPRASELFTSFLRTLARHERLDLLPLVLQQSRRLHEERSGQRRVHVTSARPLSQQTVEQVRDRVKAAFAFEPILETETDPSLLGGLVIRVGSMVYDGSLKTRLKQLLTRLSERSLHEIQSGRDRFSHPEGD